MINISVTDYMEYKYHYFYKITNNINGHYYYGVHNTDNLDDGYMGSGKRLRLAYEKYGIGNFTKDILKFFGSSAEAFEYEKKIVDEFLVKDPDCYNIQQGGRTFNCAGLLCVKDKDNNYFLVAKDDPRYLNNELEFCWKGWRHTRESRDKTRRTMTKNGSVGKRIWINKDGIVKYLLKKYLTEYLENGWSLGRPGYKPRKNCQGKPIKMHSAE